MRTWQLGRWLGDQQKDTVLSNVITAILKWNLEEEKNVCISGVHFARHTDVIIREKDLLHKM